MSWFSQFIDDPGDFISEHPWKALGLLAAPVAAVAAPFLAPEVGAAAGLWGAGEAAGGAALGEGALAGASLEGLAGGAASGTAASEGLFGGMGLGGLGGEAGGLGSGALSFSGEPAVGMGGDLPSWLTNPSGMEGADAMAYAPEAPVDYSEGLPGGSGFGGEAAPMGGGADPYGAAASGSEKPGFLSNLWDKATNDPLKAAGIGLSGAGLAYNLASSANNSPNVAAMQASAGAQSAQAKQLMSYLQKGQLPPGLEGIAKTMQQSMDAQAIANAAKNGLSTDPTQNTSLMNQLSANKERVFGWIAQQGVQLLNSGIQLSGLSNGLYAQLEALDRQKAQQTGQAIANFAAALNGGGSGIYKKVA